MNYIDDEQEETTNIPTNDEQDLGEVSEEQKSPNPYIIISIAVIVILLGVFGYFYNNNLNKSSLTTEIIPDENTEIQEKDSLPFTVSITEGERVKLWNEKTVELSLLDFTTGAHQQSTIVLNIISPTDIERSTHTLMESFQYDIQGIKINVNDITSTSTTLVLDRGVSPEDILVNSPEEFTLLPNQAVHTSQNLTYILDNSNLSLQYVDITLLENDKFVNAFKLKKDSSYTHSGSRLTVIDILPDKAIFTLGEEESLFQEETADWKTYRNEEYGFEFKYHGEDIIKETFITEPEEIGVVIETPNFIFYPAIYVIKNVNKLTLEDRKNKFENEPYISNVKKISILGKDAISYEAEMGAYWGEIVNEDYIYRFSAYGLWEKYKMLNTFKFLN